MPGGIYRLTQVAEQQVDGTWPSVWYTTELWTWGSGQLGQLGLNNTSYRSSPVQVGQQTSWSSISAGENSMLAIRSDGTLWSWGYNENGQLGLSDSNWRSSPVQVGAVSTWLSIAAAGYHGMAVSATGTLWVWGQNSAGELGLGDTVTRSSPVQVGTQSNWATLGPARNSSAVVKSDGTLWVWGSNSNGMLGLGDTMSRSSPVQVGSLTNWLKISGSQGSMSAVKNNGTLWAWGDGQFYGHLGLGDTFSRSSPVQVGALTTWSESSSSTYNTVAKKTDGTLWAWGRNSYGELGLGTSGNTTNKSSPVQVGVLTNWRTALTGLSMMLAVKSDNTLWSWGENSQGRLGLGNTSDRSAPVQIGTLAVWNKISVRHDFCAAIAITS